MGGDRIRYICKSMFLVIINSVKLMYSAWLFLTFLLRFICSCNFFQIKLNLCINFMSTIYGSLVLYMSICIACFMFVCTNKQSVCIEILFCNVTVMKKLIHDNMLDPVSPCFSGARVTRSLVFCVVSCK